MNKKTKFLTISALITALYVALTAVSALLGIDKGVVQFRLSEALTVLPVLTPAAIPGLTLGCLVSNFAFGALPPDILFGTLATLLGALGTRLLGQKSEWLAALPPILSNTVIVPLVLKFAYRAEGTVPFFMLTVFVGQFVCCGILGLAFLRALPNRVRRELK